jgi:hypothetical protein
MRERCERDEGGRRQMVQQLQMLLVLQRTVDEQGRSCDIRTGNRL